MLESVRNLYVDDEEVNGLFFFCFFRFFFLFAFFFFIFFPSNRLKDMTLTIGPA